MTDAIQGVIVGGAVSLATALVMDVIRSRRERRERWHRDLLDAVTGLIAAAQEFEGAQYRRGRAVDAARTLDTAPSAEREESGRLSYQQLLVAAARARVIVPSAVARVDALLETSKKLKKLAEVGFATKDESWVAAREEHRSAVDDLSRYAAERLGLTSIG